MTKGQGSRVLLSNYGRHISMANIVVGAIQRGVKCSHIEFLFDLFDFGYYDVSTTHQKRVADR